MQNDARAAGRHARVGVTSERERDPGPPRVPRLRRPHPHRLHRAALLRGVLRRRQGDHAGAGAPRHDHAEPRRREHGQTRSPIGGSSRATPCAARSTKRWRSWRLDFLVNVALNRDKAVTRCFAGDPVAACREGMAFVRGTSMVPAEAPFDIVVTTNSGLAPRPEPLPGGQGHERRGPDREAGRRDRDRGRVPRRRARPRLVRPAAAGVAEPRRAARAPPAPGFAMDDQWQAHTLALIVKKAEVHVHAAGLTDAQVTSAMCVPCPSVERRVEELLERFGPAARVCVLPEGPQTIPYIADAARGGPT
ncbi:MAG: hypothetical protein MZV64_25995 [Ignavibacteriales bacterium]|nr:hypothetical protein [Ignavibacteriales bacterium]